MRRILIALAIALTAGVVTGAGTWTERPRPSSQDQQQSTSQREALAHFEQTVLPILKANCFQCHTGAETKGELRLSDRASLLEGGESGPAVDLENPEDSLLLSAINYDSYEMPPKGKLARGQIEAITKWVEAGAPYPKNMLTHSAEADHQGPPPINAQTKSWWSFQPVRRPDVPRVADADWVRSPIDAFILAKLEAAGLKPSPRADKAALLRRAAYDLTGLPPSPAQVQAFLADRSAGAWERAIDELLASPHYGEKWGRHWLDLVRYAESNSYERDGTKPYVWRYRDYVIRSFNGDKPYDRFLTEQLAGDEIEHPSAETVIATGYYRLGIWQDEPVDPVESTFNDLDDILVTTSESMLGLTIGCARCHDHKIDPIHQRDYYSMLAFFRNVRRYGVRSRESVLAASVMEVDRPAEKVEQDRQTAEYDRKLAGFSREMEKLEKLVADKLEGVEKEDFQYEMNRLAIMSNHVGDGINKGQMRRYKSLIDQRRKLREQPPSGLAQALCVKEAGRDCPQTFILTRGNAHAPGEEVQPSFPAVLSPPAANIVPPTAERRSSGRRLALARWITSPDNPLTARVFVNRLWQHHFGRGIVRSTSDYGFQGTPPTHPELLDWLASEFVSGGWTIKRMHKLIMLSNAYQMSSRANASALEIDATNDLFWRFNPRRLLAEEVRDSILAVNGSLNLDKMYGPSMYVTLPAEVLHGQSRPGADWHTSSPQEQARRSLYIHVKRSLAVPLMASFDMADPDKSCPVRFVTTQPTQALATLNSRFINDQAEVFAEYLRREAGADPAAQVKLGLWRACQREPGPAEVARGVELMKSLQQEDGTSAEVALRYFCLLTLNLNEFMYLD